MNVKLHHVSQPIKKTDCPEKLKTHKWNIHYREIIIMNCLVLLHPLLNGYKIEWNNFRYFISKVACSQNWRRLYEILYSEHKITRKISDARQCLKIFSKTFISYDQFIILIINHQLLYLEITDLKHNHLEENHLSLFHSSVRSFLSPILTTSLNMKL